MRLVLGLAGRRSPTPPNAADDGSRSIGACSGRISCSVVRTDSERGQPACRASAGSETRPGRRGPAPLGDVFSDSSVPPPATPR